jgi:hypothetical protein
MSTLTTQEEIKMFNSKGAKDCWINPAKSWELSDDGQYVRPQTIYFGTKNGLPTWEEPAFDMNIYREGMTAIKSGSTDRQKIRSDPYLGKWANIAHEYDELVQSAIKSGSKSSLKSAGIGLTGDFSAIDVINVANELINTELRAFSLEQAVTEIAVPQLTISIDTYTRFTAQKNIGEGVPPILKLGSIARTTYDLPKDGGGVGLTFESQTRASHDLMRTHIDNLVADLRRIKAATIATMLETATDVTGEDFGAYSSGLWTYFPLDKIGAITDTIYSNNGTPDTVATHDKVFREYMSNQNTHQYIQGPQQNVNLSNAKVIQSPPNLPGVTWYIDNSKTSTLFTMYDKRAAVKFQGPIRTAVVRMEMEDVDAFRVFDFNTAKLLIAGRARDLTGVTA